MKRILACIVILSASICQTKSNKCCGIPQIQLGVTNLQNIQSRILNLVNTIIENLPSTACDATPITAATTITAPGSYCIANDITGDITISSANVSLNFNDFALAGSLTISGSNLQVYNGTIVGTGSGNGILISDNISDILISHMDISGASIGISANLNNNVILSGVISHNNITDGGFFSNQTNLIVTDSIFSDQTGAPTFNGLRLGTSSRVLIDRCLFANNTGKGLYDLGTNSNVIVQNCTANLNANEGFYLSSNSVTLNSCTAINNSEGFFLISPGPITLKDCTALSNTDNGFVVSALSTQITFFFENCISNNNASGFNQEATAAIGTFKSCSATNNTGCGFNDVVGSTVSYVSNYSSSNGNNYCVGGGFVGPAITPYFYVTPPTGATYWDNVSN